MEFHHVWFRVWSWNRTIEINRENGPFEKIGQHVFFMTMFRNYADQVWILFPLFKSMPMYVNDFETKESKI